MQEFLSRPENKDLKVGPPTDFADHPTGILIMYENSRGPKDKRRDPAVMRKQLNEFDVSMCGQHDPTTDPWMKLKNLALLNPKVKEHRNFIVTVKRSLKHT